jgi:hypothetical protein
VAALSTLAIEAEDAKELRLELDFDRSGLEFTFSRPTASGFAGLASSGLFSPPLNGESARLVGRLYEAGHWKSSSSSGYFNTLLRVIRRMICPKGASRIISIMRRVSEEIPSQ